MGNEPHAPSCSCDECASWRDYLWWRAWAELWLLVGLMEQQWAELYAPFIPPPPSHRQT